MKILVVRFSSIGDVVLTTPVIRALKQQLPNVEIHFLTKKPFASILRVNQYVDKVYMIDKSINECVSELKAEEFDWIIDLHNNLRTRSLKLKLRRPAKSFSKLNWKKWLLVKFKINNMPNVHIVERYFETVQHLGVKNDGHPCEFTIEKKNEVDVQKVFGVLPKQYLSIVIGAKFGTKQLPLEKIIEIISHISIPIVLVGGPDDKDFGDQIVESTTNRKVINVSGRFNLQGSASILSQSSVVLTNDTGMMHIASTFDVRIVSVWGNTTPDLGMYPYRPSQNGSFTMHQVSGLKCRPCSKIGYSQCPKGHFDCMQKQNVSAIVKDLNEISLQ